MGGRGGLHRNPRVVGGAVEGSQPVVAVVGGDVVFRVVQALLELLRVHRAVVRVEVFVGVQQATLDLRAVGIALGRTRLELIERVRFRVFLRIVFVANCV